MGLLLFFLLLFIAALAAGIHSLIVGWNGLHCAARFAAYAMLLIFPTLFPKLIGG